MHKCCAAHSVKRACDCFAWHSSHRRVCGGGRNAWYGVWSRQVQIPNGCICRHICCAGSNHASSCRGLRTHSMTAGSTACSPSPVLADVKSTLLRSMPKVSTICAVQERT